MWLFALALAWLGLALAWFFLGTANAMRCFAFARAALGATLHHDLQHLAALHVVVRLLPLCGWLHCIACIAWSFASAVALGRDGFAGCKSHAARCVLLRSPSSGRYLARFETRLLALLASELLDWTGYAQDGQRFRARDHFLSRCEHKAGPFFAFGVPALRGECTGSATSVVPAPHVTCKK